MDRRAERVVELASEIASRREQLRMLEVELERLLIVPPAPGDAAVTTGMVAGSLASRIVAWLDARPSAAFDISAIARGIGATHLVSVRGTLQRLVASGRVVRAERGRFRAVTEAAATP